MDTEELDGTQIEIAKELILPTVDAFRENNIQPEVAFVALVETAAQIMVMHRGTLDTVRFMTQATADVSEYGPQYEEIIKDIKSSGFPDLSTTGGFMH